MLYCALWKTDVSGAICPMIFRHTQRYRTSTMPQSRAGYGREYEWHWLRKSASMPDATRSQVTALSTHKASRQRTRQKNEGLTGEKPKGRKRHIVVDTMENLLAIRVHAANIHDTKSGIMAAKLAVEKYPSIKRFCADAGYRKSFEADVQEQLALGVDISARIKPG